MGTSPAMNLTAMSTLAPAPNFVIPILAPTFQIWNFTVASEIPARSPISLFVIPCVSNPITWTSRAVRPSPIFGRGVRRYLSVTIHSPSLEETRLVLATCQIHPDVLVTMPRTSASAMTKLIREQRERRPFGETTV